MAETPNPNFPVCSTYVGAGGSSLLSECLECHECKYDLYGWGDGDRVRDGTEALAGDGDGDGDGNGAGPVLEALMLALSPPAWDFWSRRWTGRDAYIAGGTPEGAVFARLNQVGRQN